MLKARRDCLLLLPSKCALVVFCLSLRGRGRRSRCQHAVREASHTLDEARLSPSFCAQNPRPCLLDQTCVNSASIPRSAHSGVWLTKCPHDRTVQLPASHTSHSPMLPFTQGTKKENKNHGLKKYIILEIQKLNTSGHM